MRLYERGSWVQVRLRKNADKTISIGCLKSAVNELRALELFDLNFCVSSSHPNCPTRLQSAWYFNQVRLHRSDIE